MVLTRALPVRKEEYPPDRLMDEIHPQNGALTVRIGFYKVGRLQYISHLDLQRSMKRAMLRSGLPVWFSEGFNPHPKMVFATPLSIGIESVCEFADIRMTAPVTPRDVLEKINGCLPEELQLWYAAPPVRKMTDAAWAEYEIVIEHPDASAETAKALDRLYAEPLILTKRSKAGDKDTDITPFIRSAHTEYGEDGRLHLTCLLCADNQNFLNPEYLLRGAERGLGLSFDDPRTAYYTILRTELYCADGVTPFC